MDFGFHVDVPQGRIQVTPAGRERGFAFGAAQDGDEVRFVAVVAEDFGRGAGVSIPLHVGFASAVVDDLAWWFASNPEGVCEVAREFGSPECVKDEAALG